MLIEFPELVWQNIRIRNEIKMLFAKPFLHPHNIVAQSVLSGNFVTLWEMVDFLVFVQALIKIAFATTWAPQNIPFMTFSWRKISCFQFRPNQFIVKSEHFVEEFTVFYVVAFLVTVKLHSIGDHLLIGDILENKKIWLIFIVVISWLVLSALSEETWCSLMRAAHWRIHSPIWDISRSSWRTAIRCVPLKLILQIFEFGHYFSELSLSFLFLDAGLGYDVLSLPVDEVTCSGLTRVFTIDTFPVWLEIWLNMLQPI